MSKLELPEERTASWTQRTRILFGVLAVGSTFYALTSAALGHHAQLAAQFALCSLAGLVVVAARRLR